MIRDELPPLRGLGRWLKRSLLIFSGSDVRSEVVDRLDRCRAAGDCSTQRRISLRVELRRTSFQEDTCEMLGERLRLIPFAESQVNLDDIKA